MAIDWYAPKPKQSADVKVTKASIVFTEGGVQKLYSIDQRFADATHVRLGWDAQRSLIAIAPAPDGEKGHFKIGRRGRNQNSRTINAAKFFEAFALSPDETAPNDPTLSSENGVAVFRLNVPQAVEAAAKPRQRRARTPKSTS
jgi:hypothetical protein